MDLPVDLLIKIVALITAVVGLYKAANIEAAKPFLEQVFASFAILVVPAAMLAFLWIMNTMTHMMDRPKESVSYTGSDAEIMYKISREFWNQSQRQEALKLTIERAFAAKEWGVIVRASEDLNPTSQRDEVLMRAEKALAAQ